MHGSRSVKHVLLIICVIYIFRKPAAPFRTHNQYLGLYQKSYYMSFRLYQICWEKRRNPQHIVNKKNPVIRVASTGLTKMYDLRLLI